MDHPSITPANYWVAGKGFYIYRLLAADFFDYRRDAKRVPVAILLLDFRLCSSKLFVSLALEICSADQ